MNHKPEISQETKNELRDTVISNLFILPAFRLKGRQIDVLNTYALSQLINNISQIQLNKDPQSTISDSFDQTSQSTNRFIKPKEFQDSLNKIKITHRKRVRIALRMMSITTRRKLFWSILLIVAASIFVRLSNIWFNLAGIVCILAFPFVLLAFWSDITLLYTLVNNLFNYLYRVVKGIQLYIKNIDLIKNQKDEMFIVNIENLSNKIIKEFINEEIRQTDYNEKKINITALSFAFMVSFIVIFVTGDAFIVIVKQVANLTGMIGLFPAIQDLNVQTFWLIFLFPLSLAWARDLATEVSKGYRKKLYQSLFLIDLYEED